MGSNSLRSRCFDDPKFLRIFLGKICKKLGQIWMSLEEPQDCYTVMILSQREKKERLKVKLFGSLCSLRKVWQGKWRPRTKVIYQKITVPPEEDSASVSLPCPSLDREQPVGSIGLGGNSDEFQGTVAEANINFILRGWLSDR